MEAVRGAQNDLSARSTRTEVFRDGTAKLYRFRRPTVAAAAPARAPVLLVPSLINRWSVLDLRPGSSVVEALAGQGFDVFVLDWGEPNDEDRYLTWDLVVARLGRMVRRTKRIALAQRVGLLGYSVGGTLSAIYAALEPSTVSALVNLAGPIDFAEAGRLRTMTDPRWFNAEAIAEAGNIQAAQLQAGFVALRPTMPIASLFARLDPTRSAEERAMLEAIDGWAYDNIAFPAAAYGRYVRALYQENQLVRGEHEVLGRRVDLGAIRCPVLTVATDRDTICPRAAAIALNDHISSTEHETLTIPGGHVSGVVGLEARTTLYPALGAFFARHLTIAPH